MVSIDHGADKNFTSAWNLRATVKDVKSLEGDAHISSARGKRKHIYDFKAEIEWEMNVSFADGPTHYASGTLFIDDISGDLDYEMSVKVDNSVSGHLMALVSSYIKAENLGLQPALIQALNSFHSEFKKK